MFGKPWLLLWLMLGIEQNNTMIYSILKLVYQKIYIKLSKENKIKMKD